MLIADASGRLVLVNARLADQFGRAPAELVGQPLELLVTGHGEESDVEAVRLIRTALKERVGCRATLKSLQQDGSELWNQLAITAVFDRGKRFSHFIGVLTDVSETMLLSRQLSYHASHDALTGLINRREFEQRLDHCMHLARRDGLCHVLCYLDLDNFKIVNDSAGHAAGDELLRLVAQCLTHEVRASDSVARLGSDEFGILLANCDLARAGQVMDKLLQRLDEMRFQWRGRTFRCGASLGLVPIDSASPSLGEVLRQADEACYAAKEAGGSRQHTYRAHDTDIARRKSEVESVSLIHKGLDEERFFLACQKVAPLNVPSEPRLHFEILLRLRDPDTGAIILPGRFLPAAERFRLSPQLDRWVIDRTFASLARAPRGVEELFLCAINLSGISMTQAGMKDYINAKLDQYGIPGEKICFEITETTAIENMADAIGFIEAVKERGCRFALDDFGSGLSSFAYLRSLPVDFVKIDGGFVRDIHDNPVHLSIVKSIHEIACLMGKQTTAEFVENTLVLDILRAIGVHYVQGYAIGMPSELDEVLARA